LIITAWRITKSKYKDVAFTGEGAEDAGGRWNSRGTRIVYASSSISLAIIEILVNLHDDKILSSYVVIPFHFDDKLMKSIENKDLPGGWASLPSSVTAKSIGDDWVQSKTSLLLGVPSVVVPIEINYLINPSHPDFGQITYGDPIPLPLDERLIDLLN
jgi:RES domain-containing protein